MRLLRCAAAATEPCRLDQADDAMRHVAPAQALRRCQRLLQLAGADRGERELRLPGTVAGMPNCDRTVSDEAARIMLIEHRWHVGLRHDHSEDLAVRAIDLLHR